MTIPPDTGKAVPVLKGIDFHAERGEIVSLEGPSGSGKTTLAKLIAGFYAPTEGTIYVDGVAYRTFANPARVDFAIVQQIYQPAADEPLNAATAEAPAPVPPPAGATP